MRPLRTAPGWLTVIALAAVAAVNLAGLWGIAVTRQVVLEGTRHAFDLDVAAKAAALETRLAQIRSDLVFLGGSPTLAWLDEADPHSAAGLQLRQAAQSALLQFLLSHTEVSRLGLRSADGRVLPGVGRRLGVPVLWVSAATPTGQEGAAIDPRRRRLTTRLPQGERAFSGGVRIEMEVEAAQLLEQSGTGSAQACQLRDAQNQVLGRFPVASRARGTAERVVTSEAPVSAEGWSVPGPFTLACSQPAELSVKASEPVWARYRITYALNLAVMGLALLLGYFTLSQARRRAGLEARAFEEARVRELERQLFHAERLTTVGRLAAGIAHELNNPLEGMSNYLTLARDALGRGETEAITGYLVSVKQGLDRAAGIVRQVLAHADPAKAPRNPVDLNQVLREAEGFVRSRKEFRHIRFMIELHEGPLVVHGSPVMLGQVATNLIVNACEAQPGRGEVLLSSRVEAGQAIAEFADRGPGIMESDRQRVFEPFFSTKASTGLGLSICHTIVRQHDGELDVRPREGGGSVFRMRLPVLAEGAAVAAEVRSGEAARR